MKILTRGGVVSLSFSIGGCLQIIVGIGVGDPELVCVGVGDPELVVGVGVGTPCGLRVKDETFKILLNTPAVSETIWLDPIGVTAVRIL